MESKTKLVWLELVGGILGWVWILASLAGLYFLAMAIFSDSPWSRFFLAIGVGAIAKWLATGFRDNQLRVAFVAEQMGTGLSREEAGKLWFDRYTGNTQFFGNLANPTPPDDTPPNVVVADFGDVLEKRPPVPGCVADVVELPYTKDEIKRAILAMLAVTNDPKLRESLRFSYFALAGWQAGVGTKRIGYDPTQLDSSMPTIDLAKEVVASREQMKRWQPIIDAEQEALIQELKQHGYW